MLHSPEKRGTQILYTVGALSALFSIVACDSIEKGDDCTYVIQPGDRLYNLANGSSSLEFALAEAAVSDMNGNIIEATPHELMPGYVLHLGKNACQSLEENGLSITWQSDYPS